jgi:hypothetical protein
MVIKQKFANHIRVTEFSLSTGILSFLLWRFVFYDDVFLLSVSAFYIFSTLPAVYLHIEYFLYSYNKEIEIVDEKIVVRTGFREKVYLWKDLKKIIIYKSGGMDRGSFPMSAMDYYRYARIIAESGEEIIITCLMNMDIEDVIYQIRGVPVERKKRMAFIGWK